MELLYHFVFLCHLLLISLAHLLALLLFPLDILVQTGEFLLQLLVLLINHVLKDLMVLGVFIDELLKGALLVHLEVTCTL